MDDFVMQASYYRGVGVFVGRVTVSYYHDNLYSPSLKLFYSISHDSENTLFISFKEENIIIITI